MENNKKALEAIDEASNRFDKILTQAEPDANGKILGSRPAAFMRDEEIKTIRLALQASKALLEDGGWRDIESAPKDGSELLAKIPLGKSGKIITEIIWWNEKHGLGAWIYKLDQGFEIKPTHWKPLDSEARALEILSKIGGE